jgi:hypothetical protein
MTTFMTNVKYPQVHVKLIGVDSNVFLLIGACTHAAKRASPKLTPEQIGEFTSAVFAAGSYDHALQIMMQYFDVH